MPDDTYRPQKKSIDTTEISSPAENQAKLENIAKIREAANVEEPTSNKPFLNPDSGIKVEGNMPPEFKKMLENRGNQPDVRPVNPKTDMRVTGSKSFEELVDKIGDFTSIYEEIQLPSKGRFYDGSNGPPDGVINIRAMTGSEEEILATPKFVKKGQALDMIFKRCMKESYPTEQFLSADRTYILIYLRGISYSPQYDVEIRCPETDKPFAETIQLDLLNVDYCPDNFSLGNLVDTLPTTGFNFTYRLSQGNDEKQVQDYRDRRIKEFDMSGQSDDTLLYRTALLVEQIEGISDKHELRELLKRLPINDVAYLRTVVNDPPFGVDTKIEITSPFTMSEFEIELPLEANFFFPRAKRNQKMG